VIGLGQAARAGLEGGPVVEEGVEVSHARLPLDAHLAKAGRREERFQARCIGESERQVQHVAFIGKMLTQRLRENAPLGRAPRRRDHTHGCPAAWPEHPAEFLKTTSGIGEEHQAELTDHRVEDAVSEG